MFGFKRRFLIDRLDSGGLITNYYCTSRCRHCLYGCSPGWEKNYIDRETAEKSLVAVKSLGCHAIHVGGGEPFLNLKGLYMVVETAHNLGVHIEYVETNSSWYRDRNSACEILTSLRNAGLSTLLISISPFHNEHIPFCKVKGILEACRTVGMNVFPWISDFYHEIDAFDDKTTHSMDKYVEQYGRNYVRRLPSRYWIHFGGRALHTFSRVFGTKPLQQILSSSRKGCNELLAVNHFHVDLFGNYVPGLCSGLAIHRDDLGEEITGEDYPHLDTLFHKGIAGLFEAVSSEYGYEPADGYLSKCHLCFDLRRFLVLSQGVESKDLAPRQFYAEV